MIDRAPRRIMSHRWSFLLFAGAAAACTGNIGEGPLDENGGPGLIPGTGGAGVIPGTGGAGVIPGAGGTGVLPLPKHCAQVAVNPGRSTLGRLSKVQYNYTLQDMLGLVSQPGRDLPPDTNSGHSLAPLDRVRVEALVDAAARAVTEALAKPGTPLLLCSAPPGDLRCREQILSRFATRAYRRPARAEDVKKLVDLTAKTAAAGSSETEAIGVAMQAVLASPRFLYFVTNEPATAKPGDLYALDDYELASRLSYFLWSSLPDDALLARAAKPGELRKTEVVTAEVSRMLKDAKVGRLVEGFAGGWLHLGAFNSDLIQPEPLVFPKFDAPLRGAMVKESELFFRSIIDTNASPLALLGADYTFVNKRLADHYGIAGVTSADHGRVSLSQLKVPRRGVLGHGSLLTYSSNTFRTNVPKRGNFVLEQLMCAPLPEPEMVPPLPVMVSGETMRERLKLHMQKGSTCIGCHQIMDPIGLALEVFDGVGAHRTKEGTADIDPSGTLPDGTAFKDHLELIALLEKDPRFPRCFSAAVTEYAIGRSLDIQGQGYDSCVADALGQAVTASKLGWAELVTSIVRSELFGKQRVDR